MKIQPLNQTALMVSWERPLTVYHPPITSYMVSYSWVKRDVADEKTFTKTGDQSMVSVAISCANSRSIPDHSSLPEPSTLFFFYQDGCGSHSSDWFVSDASVRIRGWLHQ